MTEGEWLTTREVGCRLGLRHLPSLRDRLARMGVPRKRLGPLGRIKWLWSAIEGQICERSTWHEQPVADGKARERI